jgi:hypothetical protein
MGFLKKGSKMSLLCVHYFLHSRSRLNSRGGLIAAGLQFYGSQVCNLSSSGAELMIQKVTVNNMDVMFALCTSLQSVPVSFQCLMDWNR